MRLCNVASAGFLLQIASYRAPRSSVNDTSCLRECLTGEFGIRMHCAAVPAEAQAYACRASACLQEQSLIAAGGTNYREQ